MYKEDLALNNLQWLVCHKTQLKKKLNHLSYGICQSHQKSPSLVPVLHHHLPHPHC